MALIVAHLNVGIILVVTVYRQVYNLSLTPPPYPLPLLLSVPNKPYGFVDVKHHVYLLTRARACVCVMSARARARVCVL